MNHPDTAAAGAALINQHWPIDATATADHHGRAVAAAAAINALWDYLRNSLHGDLMQDPAVSSELMHQLSHSTEHAVDTLRNMADRIDAVTGLGKGAEAHLGYAAETASVLCSELHDIAMWLGAGSEVAQEATPS